MVAGRQIRLTPPAASRCAWEMCTMSTQSEGRFMRKFLVFIATCIGIAAAAHSYAAAPYYAGKTITIVVGDKPGGGYDSTARLLARHLPKHIPGNPTIIVQNMPGANSIIAAN